jgi:ABC-type ATPase with predicted acetyltransferase domain
MINLTVPSLRRVSGVRTPNAVRIAREFALVPDEMRSRTWPTLEIDLAAGKICALMGPSGSGKSQRLGQIRHALERTPGLTAFELPELSESGEPVIDLFGSSAEETLAHLARVGLAEAPVLVRAIGACSSGERWRLRLALAQRLIEFAREDEPDVLPVLCIDEFTSCLDRITAFGIAHHLRRWCDVCGVCAIIATPFNDVLDALDPERAIHMTDGG